MGAGNSFRDLYGPLRMWESLVIRRLGVPENVGSNPTILTDLPRSTTVVQPAVNGRGVGSSPTGAAAMAKHNGRASRPATATARKAVEAQALAGSTPVPSALKDVLLGEQCGSNPHAEGSTPSVLAGFAL
jgi:hypothetical protein